MIIDTNAAKGTQISIKLDEQELHRLVVDDKALEKYLTMLAAIKHFTGIDDVWIMEKED